jgi:hypothetical protein
MTLTIELSDEQVAVLKAKAAAEGLSLEEWIQKLAETEKPIAQRPLQTAADIVLSHLRRVPADVMESMPKDGASQHDHYIYGWPTRGMTPLFADTFYWIALADFTDSAHGRALAITSERADSPIITTDEVLTEYRGVARSCNFPCRPSKPLLSASATFFHSSSIGIDLLLVRRFHGFEYAPSRPVF